MGDHPRTRAGARLIRALQILMLVSEEGFRSLDSQISRRGADSVHRPSSERSSAGTKQRKAREHDELCADAY